MMSIGEVDAFKSPVLSFEVAPEAVNVNPRTLIS
jgi:hypothetical protein